MNKFLLLIGSLLIFNLIMAQAIPTEESNIDYIVTYGNEATKSYGDDDFS